MPKLANWNGQDRAMFRKYLSENPNFLEAVKAFKPTIEGTTIEESAMTGQRHAGFEDALEALSIMASDDNNLSDQAGFINESEPTQ